MRPVRSFLAAVLAFAVGACTDAGDGTIDPGADPCASGDAQTALPQPFAQSGGVVIYTNGFEVAAWNHELDGLSTGEIVAPLAGATGRCEIRFIDHSLPREATTNRPGTVVETSPCFTLASSVADPAVAAIEPIEGDAWGFRVRGLAAGNTTAVFAVRRGSTTVAETGAIRLVVEDPNAPPAQPMDFTIVLNGIRYVFAIGGQLVPSCGATTATPGYLEAKVGEITDGHYSFRKIEAPCTARLMDEAIYHMAYEFREAGICGIVDHPEHYGVLMTFHLEGLTAGQTDMRVRVFENAALIYRSPWIPVVVTP